MTRHECQRQALILQAQTFSVTDTLFDHPPLGVTIWLPATQTPSSGGARLWAWLYRVKHANLPALTALAATIRRWRTWIVHFFRDRVTNRVAEGSNTKSKLLKRIAYGLPNFAHSRVRLLMEFTSERVFSP